MPTVRKDQETWGLEADRPAAARRCCESGKKFVRTRRMFVGKVLRHMRIPEISHAALALPTCCQ